MTLRVSFNRQRWHAKERGIAFLLTFQEWLSIWQASGHLGQRGRGHGKYVMARIGDLGPYAIGNITIVLSDMNQKEQSPPMLGRKHSEESRAKMSIAAIGNANGRANKGRTFSPETIAKMSAAKIGNTYRRRRA